MALDATHMELRKATRANIETTKFTATTITLAHTHTHKQLKA